MTFRNSFMNSQYTSSLREYFSDLRDSEPREAVEGYNPVHDLCRLVTGAALACANRWGDHGMVGYEFALIQRGRSHDDAPRPDSIWLRLDDETLGEKIGSARGHPHLRNEVSSALDGASIPALRDSPELAAEIQSRIDEMGPQAFRVEHL